MGRKPKPPARLEGWYHVTETYGKGTKARTMNLTIDFMYAEMTFGRIRDEMEAIEREHGAEFEKFKFESEMESYPYEEREHLVTYVYGWRKENDEEYAARMNKAAEMEAAREARERAEFERLAKKFADKG